MAGHGGLPAAQSETRRFGRLRDPALQLLLGLLIGLAAREAYRLGGTVWRVLDVGAGAAVLLGALFGPAGIIGSLAGGWATAAFGERGIGAGLLIEPVLAVAGWLAFRWVPRVGRSLPNLRSWVVVAVLAALGALATSPLRVWRSFGAISGSAVWLFWAASVTSVLIVVPALGPPLARLFGRWLARIPDEVPPRSIPRPRRRGRVVELEPQRPGSVLAPALAVLLAWGAAVLLRGRLPGSDPWLVLLYVPPVIFGARLHGVAGGTGVAALAGLAILMGGAPAAPPTVSWHHALVGQQAGVLLLSALGALAGWEQQEEATLRAEVAEANLLLRQDLHRVVRALRGAIAAKDSYTEGHVHRVATFAVEIGRRLGLEGRELEMLEVASVLHDVGKIGIPEAILNKPGPLDPEEAEVMRRHPEIGARVVESLEGLEAAASLVRHHQERWDGRTEGEFPGYPAGLAGPSIPLGARIIAVVDAFDAMTTDRPYRDALDRRQAETVLAEERDRQFDPTVVDVFLRLLDERPWQRAPA